MRFTIALACVLAACSRGDGSNRQAGQTTSAAVPATATAAGPDVLMLRVPRAGGVARVVAYPSLDSTVWTGTDPVPALDRVLGFDADAGVIAAANTRNQPLWIDLRLGTVIVPSRTPVSGLVSVDGSTIFGVGSDGAVVRFTPSGNWVYKPSQAARSVFPQPNGSAVALTGRGGAARLVRLRPPDVAIVDSLVLGDVRSGAGAPLGDRIYFTTGDHGLFGVRARTFVKGDRIALDHTVVAIAATPSGDRFYVITDSSRTLSIVDRYQDRVTTRVELPGRARDVRVDPVGRFVLVRPAAGDSAWVVSIGADKVVGTVKTVWRGDLPLVAPDAAIALVSGRDVAFVNPETGRELRRATDGASDFWYAFAWSGFRPRATALDAPTRFSSDSDTTARRVAGVPKSDSTPARPAAPVDSAKVGVGFTLSFAALLNEAKAREQAAKIVVDGQAARVVASTTDGTPIYRVVLGPYPTRDQADRVGRASGLSYYVYAGTP